jgi:hypothetical protein
MNPERIAQRLDRTKVPRPDSEHDFTNLSLVDEKSYRAGCLRANEAGLYKPTAKKLGD